MSIAEQAEEIAKVSKVFGADGELVIRLYDIFPDKVDMKEPLFVLMNGLATPLFLNRFQRKGKDKALVVFDDIDNEYRANELVGSVLLTYAEQESRRDDEELYYEDMIGFTLIDTISGNRAKVVEFYDYTNNPLFEVDLDGTSVMIPLSDELIEEINEKDRTITMNLPEGLISLYLETV